MDVLVSYSWNHFSRAKREIMAVLGRFGDPHPEIERTSVMGIAILRTSIDGRQVIRRCRELHEAEAAFELAIKWVPVDYWCDTNLDAMKKCIDERVTDRIDTDQTWGMKVEKRRWQEYHTIEIVEYLARDIDRKVDLKNPDLIVRIDVLGEKTAISVLKSDEIFSLGLPYPS
jgi:tRNA(Ser,Leu) C12 N-acetylase TAN1